MFEFITKLINNICLGTTVIIGVAMLILFALKLFNMLSMSWGWIAFSATWSLIVILVLLLFRTLEGARFN